MDLNTATWILRDSVAHIGENDSLDDDKLHRAIQATGYRFNSTTGSAKTTTNVPTVANDETLNIRTTITDFEEHWFISARIGYATVELMPEIGTIEREYIADPNQTGTPKWLGFYSNTSALLYPKPTSVQSIALTYYADFTSFTAGTANNPDLNLPNEFAYDIIWWGARAYLLDGLKGHADAQTAYAKFDTIIEQAAAKYGRRDNAKG